MAQIKLQVAILGRPNVGKSTLFNILTGKRKAVVYDRPGVTRDVQRGMVDWAGRVFEIYDAAGVSSDNPDLWSAEARQMALDSASRADKILLVVDGKFGLSPEDRELCIYAKRLNKPFLTIVNKIDEREDNDVSMAEFYELDVPELIPASFEHKHSIAEICEWMVDGVPLTPVEEIEKTIRIAVVGKPNVGKSTLVNSILGEHRVVVSPVAGTTIDSVEVPFTRGEQDYILVDTAGLRRQARRHDRVERVSAYKSEESVESADVLLLVVGGVEGPVQQDSKIVEMALDHHKGVILVVNKVDIAERQVKEFRKTTRDRISEEMHFFEDIPVVYISAKTGRGVDDLFTLIEDVWKRLNFKVSTRDINDFFNEVIKLAPSPSYRGGDVKFYYITQTNQRPPSFMTFVNEPRAISHSYRRFVTKKIKEHYGLMGIPVRLYAKKRTKHNRNTRAEIALAVQEDV